MRITVFDTTESVVGFFKLVSNKKDEDIEVGDRDVDRVLPLGDTRATF